MLYDWEVSEQERVERLRREYRRLGLYIFETFEEYMQDKEEAEEA